MSSSSDAVTEIRNSSESMLEFKISDNKELLVLKKQELGTNVEKRLTVEDKWINNSINQDTYNRWFTDLNTKISVLKAEIETLSEDSGKTHNILYKHLDALTDLKFIYHRANSLQKQELLRTVFDNQLYFQNNTYRTPALIRMFQHNLFIRKQKGLMEMDETKKRD